MWLQGERKGVLEVEEMWQKRAEYLCSLLYEASVGTSKVGAWEQVIKRAKAYLLHLISSKKKKKIWDGIEKYKKEQDGKGHNKGM